MEAAWVAAARGHEVTLFEREQELGGQVRLAAKLPGRSEAWDWARWRTIMLAKHGVKVVLGRDATAQEVLNENPDAVVVATGSTPIRDGFQGMTGQPIPGWDSPNVFVVDDILEGTPQLADRVVVLEEESHVKAGGVAELLADQGKQVEIVARFLMLGNEAEGVHRSRLVTRTLSKGVKFSPMTFIKRIGADGALLYNLATGAERLEPGVSVVLVTGRRANQDLYTALKGRVNELYRVGDCVAPRLVDAAIWDGHTVGREL